jgi:hypothetical protein
MNKVTLSRYQSISVISATDFGQTDYASLMHVDNTQIQIVDRKGFLSSLPALSRNRPADLLVVEIDTFDTGEIEFILFMTTTLNPKTPVVLITQDCLPEGTRKRYLQNANVIDVVQLADHSLAMAA